MDNDNDDIEFGFLDWDAEIDISEGNLPHWFQPGAAIHITFRMQDSLPEEVIARMVRRLEDFLRVRNLPTELAAGFWDPATTDRRELNMRLSKAEKREFNSLARSLVHRSLDQCHGACHLRDQRCAKIVSEAIQYYDGEKYHVDRFVVMPNHVHALAQFQPGYEMDVVGQSWMRYTGRLINKLLGIGGPFWSREPFDNIIRSPEQFCGTQRYIEHNPKRARLRAGEYLFWQREVGARKASSVMGSDT